MPIDWGEVALRIFAGATLLALVGGELYRLHLRAKLTRWAELHRATDAARDACVEAEGSWFNYRDYMTPSDRREWEAHTEACARTFDATRRTP